ncbi:MAG: M23 family metallopeptidase [Anaerolineales bacterium]|nr:M23 family metallopeptidase [Anaerolineales bacterium]
MAIELIPPVVGPLTQLFGENPDYYKKWGLAGHNGLDYGVPNGTPVKAAADGVVAAVAFEYGGYGNYVKLAHQDGDVTFYTYYAHLATTSVTPGQKVKAGTVIGTSDNTGASTGPHLHFGLKIPGKDAANKDYVDPMPYLKASPQPKPSSGAAAPGMVEIPLLEFEVDTELLNVRNGPGIEYSILERLSRGTVISAKKLFSRSVWVEFEPGKWCAWVFDGVRYLKPRR